MTKTLTQIRRHNKSVGQHFFDRGNPPIYSKQGNYLVSGGMGGGYVVYKYDEKTGHINYVPNPYGKYDYEPYEKKSDAINYAKELERKK